MTTHKTGTREEWLAARRGSVLRRVPLARPVSNGRNGTSPGFAATTSTTSAENSNRMGRETR